MPGRDGTGPMGLGAGAGRGLGPCATYPVQQGCGLGLGRRNGFRSGFGRGFAYQQDSSKIELLKVQKELLQRRIDLIDKQLTDE